MFSLTDKKREYMDTFDKYLDANDERQRGRVGTGALRRTYFYSAKCRDLDVEITAIEKLIESAKKEEIQTREYQP